MKPVRTWLGLLLVAMGTFDMMEARGTSAGTTRFLGGKAGLK